MKRVEITYGKEGEGLHPNTTDEVVFDSAFPVIDGKTV